VIGAWILAAQRLGMAFHKLVREKEEARPPGTRHN
jgi:hypothetical protein